MRSLLPLLLAVLLAACSDQGPAFVPAGATPWTPAAADVDSLWRLDEACSGLTGDWHRMEWFIVPGEYFDTPKGPASGAWIQPHAIYLAIARQNDAVAWSLIMRHEMLHDLLQRPEHPAAFAACGIPTTGI